MHVGELLLGRLVEIWVVNMDAFLFLEERTKLTLQDVYFTIKF